MAITDTIQAKEFTAGAPDITLKGDLNPNQMMASYGYDDAMGESFEEFLRLKKIGEIPADMEFDEYLDLLDIDIPYSKKDKGAPSMMMASEPDRTDTRNELALELFGKDLRLLTEEEMDILNDEAERLMQKFMADGGRAQYGLGSLVKSVGKGIKGVVKGVAKGVKSVAKSDLGKAALAAAALYYGGPKVKGFFEGMSLPSFGLSKKGQGTLASFAIGSLGSAALSAAEAGGLDSSDPNAEVDLDSLTGYLTRGYKNLNPNATDEEVFQFVQENTAEYRAMGGRIGYAMGTDEKVEMAAGIEGLPVRQNKAGVKELDLRETGGFIQPVGIKEKADDIPAMLSNNEFVFTADAVRAAGGGNINKGAQVMYDTMKKLESKVV